MRRQMIGLAILLPGFVMLGAETQAEEPVSAARVRPAGIDGALLVRGGGELPDAVRDRFVQLAGGEKARLVIIPDHSDKDNADALEKQLQPWKARKPADAVVVRVRSRKMAEDAEVLKLLRQATGVWLNGDDPARLAEIGSGTALGEELNAVLKRNGVLGGTAALGRRMLTGDGLDLLPGTTIASHFKGDRKQLLSQVLDKHPGLVGLGIAERTALVIKGRQMRVLGEGTVSVCLAAGPSRPARTVELKAGRVSDFTMWRRAALVRSGPVFPPVKAPVPEVPAGTLVIVGGGGMPPEVVRKFIELAGGPDAPIVVLPTAQPDPLPARSRDAALFEKAGAKNVRVLPGRERKDVEDPQNLEVLKKAKGIWFGGGRQWRFVDAYAGTKAEPLLRDVLRRGGVIGGSSAGASIQAGYLARGSPLNNTDILCEGYERGLGFLPGTAVDQHFSRRKRFADMTALMKTYPQLLGIGIDEATALIVKGHVAEIVGRGKAHFYDRNKPVKDGSPDYEAVPAGGRYNLKARKVLPAEETK